jgi:hypothetical protein
MCKDRHAAERCLLSVCYEKPVQFFHPQPRYVRSSCVESRYREILLTRSLIRTDAARILMGRAWVSIKSPPPSGTTSRVTSASSASPRQQEVGSHAESIRRTCEIARQRSVAPRDVPIPRRTGGCCRGIHSRTWREGLGRRHCSRPLLPQATNLRRARHKRRALLSRRHPLRKW